MIIPQPKAGETPLIKIKKPYRFELSNGLKVLIVANHKLPRVSFQLHFDNPPYAEGDKKGVADLVGVLLGNGTKNTPKTDFQEEIDFLGASLDFDAFGGYGSALSRYSNRVLTLLAEAILQPLFTEDEFKSQQTKMIEVLQTQEKNSTVIANRVGDFLLFGANHPSGEFISEQSLKNITLEDVVVDFKNNFVPTNAYLVIVGDVNVAQMKETVSQLFSSWKKATPATNYFPEPKQAATTEINVIDKPEAVQSEITVLNLTNLKMTDEDYFATLIANQILGGDFNSYINMNLRERQGWTYGASSSIRGDKFISKFKISTQVRNAVTADAVIEILKEIDKIRTELVDETFLSNVKAGYVGRFVMQIEKPQTVANYALKQETQQLPTDFYENYIKNINAVTPQAVQKAANKYFLAKNLRILIVGKIVDIEKELRKLPFLVKIN